MIETLIGLIFFMSIAYLVYLIGKFSFENITGHNKDTGDLFTYILCGIISMCLVVLMLMAILICYTFGAFILSKF